MFLYIKSLLAHVVAIAVIGGAVFLFVRSYEDFARSSTTAVVQKVATTSIQTATSSVAVIAEPQEEEVVPAPKEIAPISKKPEPSIAVEEQIATQPTAEEEDDSVRRIQNPYPTPPLSFETVNIETRAALVNIACTTSVRGVKSVTASGIIIDPRGVILTNAHVAQYVLLAQSPQSGLTCTIRQGSPARSVWRAEILYFPPIWIEKHAEDITKDRSTGTGEHDYAFLLITKRVDGSPLPPSFPAITPDIREGIGFLDDSVLSASYPAEFISGTAAQFDLYPLSTVTKIQELLTFYVGNVDLISLGGTAGAQAGSSGGAIVNAWNRLVGLITTTKEGETTADRDLRGITLNYIDRDLTARSGQSLSSLLSGDLSKKAADYRTNEAPALIELLLTEIANHTI